MEKILEKLERFNISTTEHGHTSLISHLKGTYEILKKWDCKEYICLAGLCHSIYGTESYSKTPATLDNRTYMQELIGKEAERLAYLFGAHRKNSFWLNLDKCEDFKLEDRFANQSLLISNQDFSDLVTISLANWLEQRPRSSLEYQFVLQDEFYRSRPYLKIEAYQDFLIAYGLI